jgi:alkylated DNA repair dioxygenase AlkB
MQPSKKAQAPPEGFRYQAEVLPIEEEIELNEQIRALPLKEFEFHGYTGKRRVMSFGWHYDFGEGKLHQVEEIPPLLRRLRERAAAFAGLETGDLHHALITEHSPGTTIGWHRDKGVFDKVVGISLLSLYVPVPAQSRRQLGTILPDRRTALGLSVE